jgi:hypothetical protein
MAVTVQAFTPIFIMSLGGVGRRAEAVNQFYIAIRHLQVLRNLVLAKQNLAPFELFLCRFDQFLASLAQDSIAAMRRVLIDAVIVISER